MEYSVFDSILLAFQLLFKFWWVYLPFFLVFEAFWLYQRFTRTRYLLGLKWVLLEITPPPDVVRSPKGVENLYAGLHAVYKGPLHWKNRFFMGHLQDWFSFEIV